MEKVPSGNVRTTWGRHVRKRSRRLRWGVRGYEMCDGLYLALTANNTRPATIYCISWQFFNVCVCHYLHLTRSLLIKHIFFAFTCLISSFKSASPTDSLITQSTLLTKLAVWFNTRKQTLIVAFVIQ